MSPLGLALFRGQPLPNEQEEETMRDGMGSGQVESDPERPIIHFGSPQGAQYPPKPPTPADQRPKPKLADDQEPVPTNEPVPEPTDGKQRKWRKRSER